jgi:nitroimidazol reductase NimA-like FMN-containing flavoprotein (pyridoxamine 5'-phosphate oxidase superfamily)
VPVSYALDGETLLVATGPGRKAAAVEAEPRISLTVAEVVDGDRWRCVVARGRARWVDDTPGRLGAFRRLHRHQGHRLGLGGIGLRDLRRLRGARVLAVEITELTGRVRG